MQVQKIQKNNSNFTGKIEKSKLLYRQIEHAKYMDGKNRKLSLQFFNVLKAIKNDGTDNCLTMKREYPKRGRYRTWDDYDGIINVKYGNLQTRTENVIGTLVAWGEALFGKKVINAKPKELKSALEIQKDADEMNKKIWEVYEKSTKEEFKVRQKAATECKKAFEDLLD